MYFPTSFPISAFGRWDWPERQSPRPINEMVSPLLGHFIFIIFAVIVLVFGHGLNMILNVLSVIVHGIRLNTLEFSTHIGLSWSGHKYEPFEE